MKFCVGSYLKGAQRGGSGRWGRLSQGPLQSHIRNLHSFVIWKLSRAGIHGRDCGQFKATWPYKIAVEAAILWNSLAKL